ncbi:MAG TPA: hypothetical protein VLA09_00165, partial [Longimicrobiales bacterium]|nr:hypothetical protein [Longimicrobiales bacterium]
ASLDTLQRFVNVYLNIVPPEVGRFRVAVPYVYLCLLDYGKMQIEVNNYGWLAQREILFNVAVEWYRVVDGRWQFYDWASVAPFIYVDDDMSMTVGRSVYGWPKTIASVAPVASDWIKDTQAPVNVATIKTMVFEDLYAGEKMQLQPLLEVDREAPLSALRVPMDALSRLTPWSIVSNVAHASSVLTRDAFKLLPGLGLLPMNEASRPENYIAMMAKLSSMGFPLRPNVSANTLNLKQFRMSEEPRRYCYQALTNGPMRFTALHGAGVLGEQNLLLGDLSGGHTIRLHQWPTLPIAQTLGLEVQSTVRGPGRDVALLKPVAPFWYKANVVYEPGTTLAWRDERGGTWHDTEGKELETSGAVAESEKSFNTALGASNRTIAGPFRFSETTVRVLPLLAYRDKLEKFVDDFLNEALGGGPGQDGERLRLWAAADDDARRTAGGEDVDSERGAAPRFAYVYLVVTSIGDVTSGTDNIGDWADYELSLCVPVLREYWKAGEPEPELRGAGLVQAFTFVDNPTATAAASEVLGIPTSNARFTLPEEQWMSYGGPSTTVKQPLLKVEAQVLPVIGGGEKAERRTILSIYDGEPPEVDDDAWRAVADRWGSALKRELERKKRARAKSKKMFDNARSMALDLLSARAPFSVYTIKQFRDVAEPDRACYQSFVRIHRTAREVMDLREIERPIHVRINEYPTQPLVENLGLVAEPVESDSGGVVYTLQPIRPFWLSGTIEEKLGKPVAIRTGDSGWTASIGETYLQSLPGAEAVDPGAEAVDPRAVGADPRAVGAETGLALDLGDPRRLTKAVTNWMTRAAEAAEGQEKLLLGAEEAAQVLRTIDPQTVIESILSREWGNWDPVSRWLRGHRDLEDTVSKLLAGEATELIGDAGTEIFEKFREERGQAHPWLNGPPVVRLVGLL